MTLKIVLVAAWLAACGPTSQQAPPPDSNPECNPGRPACESVPNGPVEHPVPDWAACVRIEAGEGSGVWLDQQPDLCSLGAPQRVLPAGGGSVEVAGPSSGADHYFAEVYAEPDACVSFSAEPCKE